MQINNAALKPLGSIELTREERTIITWLRAARWEAVKDAHAPIPYRTKVPQFYGGVNLYMMQATAGKAGALGPLELFIKKLQHQGVIGKQEMYPLSGHGSARFLSLKKADLDNLGVGKEEEEE